jgi:hypothetical protein
LTTRQNLKLELLIKENVNIRLDDIVDQGVFILTKVNLKKKGMLSCRISFLSIFQMSTKELCIPLQELHAKSLLKNNDTFLFDCDGVLWNFPDIFPGAIELLNYLTEQVIK